MLTSAAEGGIKGKPRGLAGAFWISFKTGAFA